MKLLQVAGLLSGACGVGLTVRDTLWGWEGGGGCISVGQWSEAFKPTALFHRGQIPVLLSPADNEPPHSCGPRCTFPGMTNCSQHLVECLELE